MKAELTEVQAELAKADINRDSTFSSNSDQSEVIQNLECEIENLQAKLNESERDNQDLNDEITRLSDELMKISDEKTENLGTNTNYELESLREELMTNKNKFFALEHQLLESQNIIAKSQQQVVDFQQLLTDSESTVSELNEILENTQNELIEKAQEIEDYKSKLSKLTNDSEATTYEKLREIEEYKMKLASLNNDHESNGLETKDLRVQLLSATSKVTELSSELDILSAKLKHYDDVIIPNITNDFQSKLSNSQSMLELSNSQYLLLQESFNAMHDQKNVNENNWYQEKSEMMNEIDDLKSKIQELTTHDSSSVVTSIVALADNTDSTTEQFNSSTDSNFKMATGAPDNTIENESSAFHKSSGSTSLSKNVSSPAHALTVSTKKPSLLASTSRRSSFGVTPSVKSTPNRRESANHRTKLTDSSGSISSDLLALDNAINKLNIDQILIESSTNNRASVRDAILSEDIELMKAELMKQVNNLSSTVFLDYGLI